MKKVFVSIVIPCLNEKRTIGWVIKDALRFGDKYLKERYEVIIADNGSTDGTTKSINKFKRVRLVNVPVRGYGAALHYGVLSAKGEYVLFGDADCSYPFSNLPRFIEALEDSPDMVLGSRLLGTIQKGAMPLLNRYFGTPLLTVLIRFLYKIPTTDCNSGMRVIKRSFYKTLNIRNSGMEWASEVLLKTALHRGKYLEVPIRFLKDKRDRPPHMSRWSDGWRHLKAIIMLKPQSLYPLMIIFPVFSYISYSYSFSLTFLFLSLTYLLFLGIASMELLKFGIEKQIKNTRLISFLLQFRLVPITMFFSLATGVLVLLLPDDHLGTKLFFVNIVVLTHLWLFFIETIKTHLINRLP